MTAYYNEIDPFAAQWLRNLIAAGHIAPGVVDERSIEDITPGELRGFTQCHFFAGIGVWSFALRRAGWPDSRPVWTGSCPCQPFSTAGKGAGFADKRHLWPHWFHLISECRPSILFGEQVASADVGPWIDLVQDDLESLGHAFGTVPFPSASVGAPHIRDRTYWVAYSSSSTRLERCDEGALGLECTTVERSGSAGYLAQSCGQRWQRRQGPATWRIGDRKVAGRLEGDDGAACVDEAGLRLADTECTRIRTCGPRGADGEASALQGIDGQRKRLRFDVGSSDDDMGAWPGPTNGLWASADWVSCRDGKWRPVEPGTFPLAHGAPARVGRLRAYGNAINTEAARVFIESYLDVEHALQFA